jgi:hypothetical protein
MKQLPDTSTLGAFSISLAVKNLEASRIFYEKLGFKVFAGDAAQNWLILKKRRSRDRSVPGNVRKEHSYLQSWMGQ